MSDQENKKSMFAEAACEWREQEGAGPQISEGYERRPSNTTIVPYRSISSSDSINSNEPKKFVLEPWEKLTCFPSEEWTIKRVLPLVGLAAIFGKPGSFKSMVASDIAACVALGQTWGGRKIQQGSVIYVASEGGSGIKKRIAGIASERRNLPENVPFTLVTKAPNFGTSHEDRYALIRAIEGFDPNPRMIVLDTLSQSLGGGDENSAGMINFVVNATALVDYFKTLVLIVHHSGLSEEKRLRGHSSLHGAVDALIHCERKEDQYRAFLTIQKLKDEISNVGFEVQLSRIVLGLDADGDDISTLIVDSVQETSAPHKNKTQRQVPAQQRLLNEVIIHGIEDEGEYIRPFGKDGPVVKAISEAKTRRRYKARLAENAGPDEDAAKLADRQRQAFRRAIRAMVNAKTIIASDINGERYLSFP